MERTTMEPTASRSAAMPLVALPTGEQVPALGMGTYRLGADPTRRQDEVAALRQGLELGLTLIDTAEMYADGGAEAVVGEAIAGHRDEVFLVSKVLPFNSTTKGTVAACERSLQRLGTDHLDMYLLHWRGMQHLSETLEGFEDLQAAGKIRYWGVSNFDMADMQELLGLPGGSQVGANQVLYNPLRRGIEWDLLPWCQQRRIPVMAYSPVEEGRLLGHPTLAEIGARHDATAAQVAIAWILRQPGLIAIPKSVSAEHLRQNREALDLQLKPEDLEAIDRAFPPPRGPVPLSVI